MLYARNLFGQGDMTVTFREYLIYYYQVLSTEMTD